MINQADHRNNRGRINRSLTVLIVQTDIPADHRYIEMSTGIEVRVMQYFQNREEVRCVPELTVASVQASKIAARPMPWLVELSGKGHTAEARKVIQEAILVLLRHNLKGMVRSVAAKRGESGKQSKYVVLGK